MQYLQLYSILAQPSPTRTLLWSSVPFPIPGWPREEAHANRHPPETPFPQSPAQISHTRTRSPDPMASAGVDDGAAAQPKAAISHVIFDMDGLLLGTSIFSKFCRSEMFMFLALSPFHGWSALMIVGLWRGVQTRRASTRRCRRRS